MAEVISSTNVSPVKEISPQVIDRNRDFSLNILINC